MKISFYTVYAIHKGEVKYNLLVAKWLAGVAFNFLAHNTVVIGLSLAHDITWDFTVKQMTF